MPYLADRGPCYWLLCLRTPPTNVNGTRIEAGEGLAIRSAPIVTIQAAPDAEPVFVATRTSAAYAQTLIEIGIDSFAALFPDTATGRTLARAGRVANLLEEVEAADGAGLDVFGIGEHHRAEFLDLAPAILLAAAAVRTASIRLTSAVTVLSAADPVRVFQEFATLDLIATGRAEIVVGLGSFGEAYPLFGLEQDDYDALFAEKLGLPLRVRDNTHVNWTGRYRPPLTGQGALCPAAAGSVANLGGCWRHARLFRPGRRAWTTPHGGYHRRRVPPVPSPPRAVSPSWAAGRPANRSGACRRSCLRLRRLNFGAGPRRLLPGLDAHVHHDRARAGLVARHVTAVRCDVRPFWRLYDRRHRNSRRESLCRERGAGQHLAGDISDELGVAGTRSHGEVN
jgi:alkanesulfonate monooxygenase SsuD/methylene tetrahydromethanopterin reductase-like flavin-dependent oxidoreductase (luciferase family)